MNMNKNNVDDKLNYNKQFYRQVKNICGDSKQRTGTMDDDRDSLSHEYTNFTEKHR